MPRTYDPNRRGAENNIRDRDMHIFCWLGFHSVDRKHAKFDGEVYRSRCRRCKRRMIREASGWELNPPSP